MLFVSSAGAWVGVNEGKIRLLFSLLVYISKSVKTKWHAFCEAVVTVM